MSYDTELAINYLAIGKVIIFVLMDLFDYCYYYLGQGLCVSQADFEAIQSRMTLNL